MDHNSDLLRPSLSAGRNPSAAIYSVRTEFLSAFFGGPLAAAAIALLNSYRLRRLAADWPIALMGVGLFILLGWLAAHEGWRWLDTALGRGSAEIGTRAVNLVFFGIVYSYHRTYYKSMSVLGIAPPNGLAVGSGAIVLGIVANLGLIKVFLS